MRATIEYMNECRQLHREGKRAPKSKWRAPKLAPFDPAAPVEPISWEHAKALAYGYHQARQANREIWERLAQWEADEIPF